jgi:hypothetical protein
MPVKAGNSGKLLAHENHAIFEAMLLKRVVISTRFERVTPRLGIWCSILLSYETTRHDPYKSKGPKPSLFALRRQSVLNVPHAASKAA